MQKLYISLLLMVSVATIADDRTYYLDRQSGEMLKYTDDKSVFNFNMSYMNTDNYLYENKPDQDTAYYEIAPSLKSQYRTDTSMLQVGLWALHRHVSDYSEDNSTDSYGLVKYHQSINENQSAIISAAFFNNYLERGQGLSKGTGTELEERDQRKSYFVNAAYQLGNDNSNAILKSLIGYRESTYQNRLEATQGLNHDAIYTQLDFQYNVSGKTYLTSQVTYEELNYDTNTQQDRGVTSVLAGMKWHKEEFTHFDFSLGSYFLDFDSGALQDLNDFRWKTKFRWSPIERIELSLESARSVDENRQVENSYLITDKYEFLFSYKFNEKLELFIQSRFDDSEYYYEDRNQREEAFSNNVSLFYKFRDDMSVSIGYVYKELNAIEEDIDYEKNQLVLGFGFVL